MSLDAELMVGLDVEEDEDLLVSQDLFNQITLLNRLPDVTSVGVIGPNRTIFAAGGLDGQNFRVAASHARWGDPAQNIEQWTKDFPDRHGFSVNARYDGSHIKAMSSSPNVDPELDSPDFHHRIGDVVVRAEVMEAIRGITHPAIVCIRLMVQDGMEAVIDVREGNYPKAICGLAEFAPDSNQLITPNLFKMEMSAPKAVHLIDSLNQALPELSLEKCEIQVIGDDLIVYWNTDVTRQGGFTLSSDDFVSIYKDDMQMRNRFMAHVGSTLFEKKVENPDHFFHQLVTTAVVDNKVDAEKYTPKHLLYFRKTKEGGWQVYVKIKLVNNRGPSGGGSFDYYGVEDEGLMAA